MKGKERQSGFPFRLTKGDWRRKWGSVNWHQRQREIPVRAQSWTDTPDRFIHTPLGPTTAQPASDPVPTDTLHTYTQPIPLKRHLTPHITSTFSLYVHWHALTGWKLLPLQTGAGRWVPQQKLNYFYCLTALRGKTSCEGLKSKLRWGKGEPLLTNVTL